MRHTHLEDVTFLQYSESTYSPGICLPEILTHEAVKPPKPTTLNKKCMKYMLNFQVLINLGWLGFKFESYKPLPPPVENKQ